MSAEEDRKATNDALNALALMGALSSRPSKWPTECRNAEGYPIPLMQFVTDLPEEAREFEAVLYDFSTGVRVVVDQKTVSIKPDGSFAYGELTVPFPEDEG